MNQAYEADIVLKTLRAKPSVNLTDDGIMRVLITGSRKWPDPIVVNKALDSCLTIAQSLNGKLLVVHGTARGADKMADEWAVRRHGADGVLFPERHQANWRGPCMDRCRRDRWGRETGRDHRRQDEFGYSICPAAGYYRNEEMADAGAAICLAFVVLGENESRGTRHCIDEAKKRHIDVIKFEL